MTNILDASNRKLVQWFIEGSDQTENNKVRIRYGLLAGRIGICATVSLFVLKMALGIMSGSVSIVANAFHPLSHLAASIVLVVSFKVTARPATARNPFGHGRMEHIAPLVMSVFLFVSGIQMAESSVHQAIEPHDLHYWPALPWLLLCTILVKQWLAQFVSFLGERVRSHAILASAAHHNIEVVMTLAVIGGLVAGHHFAHPEVDGYVGTFVSAWLLYLGYTHGREAIVPLLGRAPGKDVLSRIRETAKSVEGIEDVHEIIVHDYGSMYLISLHAEIPERLGAIEMHEIAERGERKLREVFGGEAVCHTDPKMERTPETQAVEEKFREILQSFPQIVSYHDFRIIAESPKRMIIVADIDVREEVPECEFGAVSEELEAAIMDKMPNIAYCGFYTTPKFAY